MGLAVFICSVIAERLNKTRAGRAITTGVAVVVIAWALTVAILLLNLTIAAALGYYP